MKRHLFRQIFLIYFAVLLLSVIFVELYITSVVRTNYIDNLKESLFIHAGLISDHSELKAGTNLDPFCEQLSKKTGARVTVIDAEGTVLGDSDHDSDTMESHADRPEIHQALSEKLGSAIRYSRTTRDDLLYVARKFIVDGKVRGFIRLAVPLSDISSAVNLLRLEINLAVILIFLFSAMLLALQTERVRKYVTRIKDYTGELAHGHFRKKLFLEDAGEFTELTHNLNMMALDLHANIEEKAVEMNRLNVIIKSIPDALLLINMNGVIELSNKAARDLFGHNDLDHRPYLEVVRSTSFSDLIDEVKESQQPGSAELVIDLPEERHFIVRISPLFYRVEDMSGIVAIFHDTTQLQKLEQMRKDFVANVSHEMRTPITAIKGFAETLLDGAVYDKDNAEKFLNTIKSNSERLNRLVEDLMTLSKIELGVIKMMTADVNISDLIDHVIRIFVVQSAEKGLTIKKSLETGLESITADRYRVEQILINLVDNAIKFTESGEVTIGTAQEGDRTVLYVKDTGIGVPEKYHTRLGERFFRVDTSRSRELGGTGLGLAIVKHLVKAHGWEMKIESNEGEGTAVKIYY